MIGGGDPIYLKLLVKVTALERNRRFSVYFARNDSAVTPSEKSSINTNRKSITRFPMSPAEHRTSSLSLQRGLKNAKCPKLEQSATITPKR